MMEAMNRRWKDQFILAALALQMPLHTYTNYTMNEERESLARTYLQHDLAQHWAVQLQIAGRQSMI